MFRWNREHLGDMNIPAIPGITAPSIPVPGLSSITSSPVGIAASVALAPFTLGIPAILGSLLGGGLGFDFGPEQGNIASQQTQSALSNMGTSVTNLIQNQYDEIKKMIDDYNAQAQIPLPQEGIDYLTDDQIKQLQYRLIQTYDIYITGMKQELAQTFAQIKEQIRQAIQIEFAGGGNVSTTT